MHWWEDTIRDLTWQSIDLRYYRVFGVQAYVLDKGVGRGKLDSKSNAGHLVGYD